MTKSIEIDRKKRLREEPGKGHNRWHPDIAPVIEVTAGEEVTLETRDATICRSMPGRRRRTWRSSSAPWRIRSRGRCM